MKKSDMLTAIATFEESVAELETLHADLIALPDAARSTHAFQRQVQRVNVALHSVKMLKSTAENLAGMMVYLKRGAGVMADERALLFATRALRVGTQMLAGVCFETRAFILRSNGESAPNTIGATIGAFLMAFDNLTETLEK